MLFNLIIATIKTMKPENLLNHQPSRYSTIYMDMNSFFASVEQFYDPKLRGRPVVVATSLSPGGSIVAASIQAKRFGVVTGTKVALARQICPDIVIVHDSPNSYRAIHRQIMQILHNTPCYVRAKSIDEAYLKVPSYMQSCELVNALVKAIKASLYNLYGGHILCSIGVSSNVWLAKMAGNSQKPNGLVFIGQKDLIKFYSGLGLTDFTGISYAMAKRFYAIGVETPLQLYMASWKLLNSKLGINGGKWYLRMHGYEVDTAALSANKSLSHQITTMPNPPSSLVGVTTYINKIAVTLGARLRSQSLSARGIALYICFDNGQWWGNIYKNVTFYSSDYEIVALSQLLLKKLIKLPSPVRRVSITLFNLSRANQLSLGLDGNMDKYMALSVAIDAINGRYGNNTIMPLRSFGANYVNLNRVGFAGDLLRETINPTDTKYYY